MILCFITLSWEPARRCNNFLEDVKSGQIYMGDRAPQRLGFGFCKGSWWTPGLAGVIRPRESSYMVIAWKQRLWESVKVEVSFCARCSRMGAALLAALVHAFPSSLWECFQHLIPGNTPRKGKYTAYLKAFLWPSLLLPGVHQGRHLCSVLTFSANWKNRSTDLSVYSFLGRGK